jgi:hypothetical protein
MSERAAAELDPAELDLLTGDAACPVCGRGNTLVAPECAEGHGADCPDRLCVACGIAVFLDPVLINSAARASSAAPRQRSA